MGEVGPPGQDDYWKQPHLYPFFAHGLTASGRALSRAQAGEPDTPTYAEGGGAGIERSVTDLRERALPVPLGLCPLQTLPSRRIQHQTAKLASKLILPALLKQNNPASI